MFRFGCVCGGASLYAPQAQNNVVRVAYEAMASALGGVQSMFTAAWDEPFALPTRGVHHARAAHPADPRLRDRRRAGRRPARRLLLRRVADRRDGGADRRDHGRRRALRRHGPGDRGGLRPAADLRGGLPASSGRWTRASARSSASTRSRPTSPRRRWRATSWTRQGQRRQLERLAEVKRTREAAEVRRTLDELGRAARVDDENLMPLLVDCAHAYCTVGEIVDVLKGAWGEFRPAGGLLSGRRSGRRWRAPACSTSATSWRGRTRRWCSPTSAPT